MSQILEYTRLIIEWQQADQTQRAIMKLKNPKLNNEYIKNLKQYLNQGN